MTCPRCYAEFEDTPDQCPECGVHLARSVSGVMKTSAVLIAASGASGFYRSVQDVPEPLRTRLIESTSSPNAGTIVIADQAGKEQMTHVNARRETARESKPEPAPPVPPEVKSPGRSFPRYSWVAWAGVGLLLAAIGVIAAVFTIR